MVIINVLLIMVSSYWTLLRYILNADKKQFILEYSIENCFYIHSGDSNTYDCILPLNVLKI
jgi:hypothetical protein